MRKPCDFDAELKTLNDKAKLLRDRKVRQLGELVIATGADALTVEQLVGLLIAGAERTDAAVKESWSKRGATFFQGAHRDDSSADGNAGGAAPNPRSA